MSKKSSFVIRLKYCSAPMSSVVAGGVTTLVAFADFKVFIDVSIKLEKVAVLKLTKLIWIPALMTGVIICSGAASRRDCASEGFGSPFSNGPPRRLCLWS